MSKVVPDGPFEGPAFKKPVPMLPPLTKFDPTYCERKAQCGEKTLTLKSGTVLAYFAEGNPADPAVVCFPSAGLNKWEFVTKEPMAGVYLIAIDPKGRGLSSPLSSTPVWADSVVEHVELLDALGVKDFFVCGHSCGGVHAMMCAASLGSRVLGCAVISSPCDVFHPSLSTAERKRLDTQGARVLSSSGCMGSLARSFMSGYYYYPDKTKDFGFSGHSAGGYSYYKGAATGGAPKAMESDHFFVTKLLDSELQGANSKAGLLYEMTSLFGGGVPGGPWSYDVASITCPCTLYNEAKGEVPLVMAERNHKLIKGSELVVWAQHGHCSIMMEFENIVGALLQGKAYPTSALQ